MACRKVVIDLGKLSRNQRLYSSAASCGSGGKPASSAPRADLEKVTHTGQVFEKDDYRNVRFTNAKRYVNENWGIKLIDEIPPKEVTERVVYCDGGNGPLGHPKVYINLDKPGAHICGYCGLRFVKKDDHHH
ncbi:NADH dehydrogenase [ubiquinone] iron-sulfur protein 6, mitochondrial [Hermetia illucens]|nr:NADH dehydrogenase [ubiquinone] iron-sulfur protein 6, mitochondrial [Hermetia illucens]